MTGRRGAESGRVSLFLAVAMTGVLAIVSLAYDGAGQLRTLQRADNLAAEAARSGGQMIDRASAIEGGPKRIDQVAARAAVADYLSAAGEVGGHDVDFPVVGLGDPDPGTRPDHLPPGPDRALRRAEDHHRHR